jgi:holin-like protein
VGRRLIRKGFQICIQIVLLIGFAIFGDTVCYWLHISFPGSILGMLLLFLLLKLNILPIKWFEAGANFLLGQMLLFFIPPVLGIIQYTNLLESEGFRLFMVLISSTVLVMVVTGGIAEWIYKRREAKKQYEVT